MANQTITTDSNHDALTGRAAGEDITIQLGATLTIDSCPHLTAMGILGDITLTEGTLKIDGSRTKKVTYSGGSGTLPSVGDAVSWNSGADTGKVIRLDSGDNASGVMTITVDVGETDPDDADTITDGSWSADVDSVAVGFLVVFGEDQDWGSVDAKSSLVITGDWYEIGVVGGEQVAYDYFDRTVSGSLGTSDDSNDWSNDADWDVSPGAATSTFNASYSDTAGTILEHDAVAEVRVRQLISWSRDPSTGAHYHNVIARKQSGADTYYFAQFIFTVAGLVRVQLNARNAGSWEWDVGATQTIDNWSDLTTEQWWCELEVSGSGSLAARVWKEGTPRPTSPQITATDASSPITGAGWTGFWSGADDAVDTTLTVHSHEVWDTTDAPTTAGFELPHDGHQVALWVETGDGTDVFEIWHRVTTYVGTIYWNGISQFGATQESGHVFHQAFGDATVTFGDSVNGGLPPEGARIRIPNVHIGTTTVGAPTTEVNSATTAAHIGVVAPNTNLNVSIDHLNASSCYVDFRGTNAVVMSDSCIGLWTSTSFINKVNAAVSLTNCAMVQGNGGTGDHANVPFSCIILDNVGGITFEDCLVFAGVNGSNAGALTLTTMANIAFVGTNKLVSNQQDENTMASLRGSVATNVTAETLICLGGPVYAIAGCNDWTIDELVFGLPPGRGTTEQNVNALNLTGTGNVKVLSGHKADGAKVGTIGLFLLTDANETTIRNFGSLTAKIDLENRATYVCSLAGITSNTKLQRLWFDNFNGTQGYPMLNSVADLLIENCSAEYTSEIELDANRVLVKGLHGASGNPDTTTGVEGDNTNVLATCFLDYFKSDTTGALGLNFNDRGVKHAGDIEIVSGTPVWNGLCDLLMRTAGDQVIYTWPYQIKGHTAFQNAAIQLAGTGTANLTYEYDLDTGSGFSGSWTTVSGANLSAETISPAGFRFKLRITCATGATTNAIKGLAILTNTTLADQAANFYPLDTVALSVEIRDAAGDLVTDATEVTVVRTSDTTALYSAENVVTGLTSYEYEYSSDQTCYVNVLSVDAYVPKTVEPVVLGATDQTIVVQLEDDRTYSNP